MTNADGRTRCPGCSTLYQLAPAHQGKPVRCRRCGERWTPAPATRETRTRPAARPTATMTAPETTTATMVEERRAPARRAKPAPAPAPSSNRRRLLLAASAVVIVTVGATLAWALGTNDAPKDPAPAPVATSSQDKKTPAKPAPAPAPDAKAPKKAEVSSKTREVDEFFKMPRVVELSLEIAPGDYEALKREPRKYVRATLKEGGKTWTNVAVHLKGAAGSFRGIDDKACFTINMDKFVDDQTFRGLDKFHLNNSVQDPSFVSELVCGELFRSLGVPAARLAHATLILNGKPKGFYALKEGYDEDFLERHLGTKKGTLYDGGFLRELDQELQVISEEKGVKPYVELKSLMNAAALPDAPKRFAEMERLLDVDRWVTYLVLEVLMSDWDGYPMNRNNYRIFHDSARSKIVFIPSGTDQMFGDPNWNLLPNFNGIVARQYMTTPEGRQRYLNRMDEILKTGWKVEAWNKRLDELEAALKPALAKVDPGHAQALSSHIGRLRGSFQQRLTTAQPALKRLLNPTPPKTIAGGPGLPDDGFLRKYLFLGPIATQGLPGAQAIHKDWLGGEAALKPATGAKAKTPAGELAWKPIEAPDGMVDFHAASGRQADASTGYLLAYLVCEKEFKGLKLKMGSDDQGKVWINGKEVLKFEGDRPAAPDQDTADVTFNKGVNTVLFKVVNGFGGFQGILRFLHPDGAPFMDARLSLTPDGK